MYFEISKSGNPLFTKIHPLLAGMLQTVTVDPWERYPDGSSRLLPYPGEDEELLQDWEDLVQPELRRHFITERAVVADDLSRLIQGRGKNPLWSIEIPMKHTDAWLTTLNACRLALASEYDLTEAELSEKTEPDFSSERGFALMQVNFFAFMQECLIRGVEE
ncbi:MAG: DUF2017 family protein [bacterium]